MAEVVRLTEVREEIFDPQRLEYDKKRYSEHNVKFSEYITDPAADAGQTYQTVATITVTTGKILNIMNLRYVVYNEDGNVDTGNQALLEIRQASAPVSADTTSTVLFALANGVIDVVNPGFYQGTLENPLARVQGTVTFRILNVDVDYEYVVTMMGDEYAPEPAEHYENMVEE